MAAVAQFNSSPSDQVIGTYDCRQTIWQRIKKLKVGNDVLTKRGARLAEICFDLSLVEPNREWVIDSGAELLHHSLKFATRRQMTEDDIRNCKRRLDERSQLWLADERSWESLALCPIPWGKIVALRRNGIHNVATLQMLNDKELSSIDGIGPGRIQLIRNFCSRALKEQEKARPKQKRIRKPKQPAAPEPALF